MSETNAGLETRAYVNAEAAGVLANSAVLLASKVVTWGLAFAMTVMLPRYLGAVGFGRLYFAISFTAIFAILVEFGLNSLVTREVARSADQAWSYLVAGSGLKMLLWAVAFAVIFGVLRISPYPRETQTAVLILAAGVVVTSLSTLVVAILQARDRMRWIAVSQIVEKAVLTGAGVAALLAGFGFVAIAGVMLVSNAVGLLLNLYWFTRLSRLEAVRSPGGRVMPIRTLFARSAPFFSMLFFGAVYFRIDVVLLSLMAGDAAVGLYGVSYKLFETLTFLPAIFTFALSPVLCRLAVRDDDSLVMASQKSLDWLLALGVPIALGTWVLAPKVIGLLYGARFAGSIPALRVLAVVIAFLYANSVLVWLLVATERQNKLAITAGIAAVLNVTVNLALIPHLMQLGAAWATLVTEVAVLGMNVYVLPCDIRRRLSLASAGKAILAGAVMVLVLVLLASQPLALVVIAGVIAYVVTVIALQTLSMEDVAIVKDALLGLASR